MKLIITGSAGFLGFSLCIKLLKNSHDIIGIDNHNNYYDPKLKEARFNKLIKYSKIKYFHGSHNYYVDLEQQTKIQKMFLR